MDLEGLGTFKENKGQPLIHLIQVQSKFGKASQYGSTEVVRILLFTSYLARILFLKECGSFFWKSTNSTKIFGNLLNIQA